MTPKQTKQVGTDLSTMEAIQSLFGEHPDPWALECLANWIDITVNHDDVLYALPKVLDELPLDIVIPDFVRQAEKEGILKPAADQPTADRIDLRSDEVEHLYRIFEAWVSSNVAMFQAWLKFTEQVRRIQAGQFVDQGPLNLWVRDKFWPNRPRGWLRDKGKRHKITGDSQQLGFDMILRAAQYHLAYGEDRAFQPHPIRALYAPQKDKTIASLSWGWTLIAGIDSGRKAWDAQRLIGAVVELRSHVNEMQARSNQLLSAPSDARREKVNKIAVRMGMNILPDILKKRIELGAKLIGVPIEILGDIHHIPFIGLAWELVQVPIRRGTEIALQHLSCVQRRVEFASKAAKPTLSAIREKLTA